MKVSRKVALGLLVGIAVIGSSPQIFSAPKAPVSKKHARRIAKKLISETSPVDDAHVALPINGLVSKINVEGTKKIEMDAIKAKLKTKVGDPVNAESLRADVQNIFDMGYFYNIDIFEDQDGAGVDLTYKVTEKPSIVEIVYKGNDRLEKDELQEASGVKPYTILDQNKLRDAIQKISKLYEDKGFFLARVQTHVEEVKTGDEVRVVFDIKENDKVRVKKITFLGNHALPDTKLKAAMQTQEGGVFSWITSSGGYKQEVFDRDVQVLSYLYFNEGYVQVKVDRPQVYVTPDKKSIYITIRIEEGEQFNVGKVDFGGDLLFSKDELFESTEIQKSGTFVYETLQKDLKSLQFKYGDLGYAFANIIPRTSIREKERLVDISFEIEKGQKVYFGAITVTGNSKTRDKVVRRELKIREGELYNETRKRKSEENVKRLGYFADVIFNSSTPPESPTTLNLEIQVKERSTGTIQIGAGYSTVGGVLFQGQISQTNLFGKGQSLAFSATINGLGSTYNLGFTEPYFNDTLWSVGFDAYKTVRILSAYTDNRFGADVRFGHPIFDYLNGYLTYKLENVDVGVSAFADHTVYNADLADGVTSSVIGSLVYDKRNDRWAPTKGMYASASLEEAGPGGSRYFTRALANFRFYNEIFWHMIFRNNINYGLIASPEGHVVPFDELFLLGGANSMRGFPWYTVGKRVSVNCCNQDPVTGLPVPLTTPRYDPFGGTQQFYWQTELEFNLIAEAQIKGVIFYDIGNADDALEVLQLRQDAGFGFRWFSPIGPLRFEWGFPLDRDSDNGDPFSNFEFSIGSPF